MLSLKVQAFRLLYVGWYATWHSYLLHSCWHGGFYRRDHVKLIAESYKNNEVKCRLNPIPTPSSTVRHTKVQLQFTRARAKPLHNAGESISRVGSWVFFSFATFCSKGWRDIVHQINRKGQLDPLPRDSRWGKPRRAADFNYRPSTIYTRSDQVSILPPLPFWQAISFVLVESFSESFVHLIRPKNGMLPNPWIICA
jgi:hypothetical protein